MIIAYLQSHDSWPDKMYLRLDGSLTEAEPPDADRLPLMGVYSKIDGELVVFWRRQGELQLVAGNGLPVALADVQCEWQRENDEADFRIHRGGLTLFERHYPLSASFKTLDWDPAPSGEPEDFDLYLFIRNVCAEPRRHVVFRSNH